MDQVVDGPSPPIPELSFLFVINDIAISRSEEDTWGQARPPTDMQSYSRELESSVMRYKNGKIEELPAYQFVFERDPDTGIGAIYQLNQRNCGKQSDWPHRGDLKPIPTYKTCTMFACHPFMPYVMVPSDATIHDTRTGPPIDDFTWRPLRFRFPLSSRGIITGVSQAVFTSHDDTHPTYSYVAGRNPSWVPSLLPPTYVNPLVKRPSRGLGGDVSILLGLMAFSAPCEQGQPRAHTTFIDGTLRWENHEWKHRDPPKGGGCFPHTSPSLLTRPLMAPLVPYSVADMPRGILICVALDPTDPSSTPEAMRVFESEGVMIMEKQ
ncbi:hypothetical protein GMORB2_2653 [Geosmithia morbida]|uniref:Uncharacterized protein n=1 Tax=Geosmithia morbida TaxID=1094350 RepID=A0A9P5D2B4_9HYPO|nr:uncharacterized protein GMORB2_2653 [Geosmithia morbida]KAF4120650.1 hypothetical protein GMORB2_2653 [Geosmithia morbida]